jgi:hypothetical protein
MQLDSLLAHSPAPQSTYEINLLMGNFLMCPHSFTHVGGNLGSRVRILIVRRKDQVDTLGH